MFTQTQQWRQWNAFFQFCSFVFNADFETKYMQFLINKSSPNLSSKDIEADSLTLFLCLCCWLLAGYCLPSYRFLYVKSLCFMGHLFSNSDLICVTYAFSVIQEQLFACDSCIGALWKRISQSKSRLWPPSFCQNQVLSAN